MCISLKPGAQALFDVTQSDTHARKAAAFCIFARHVVFHRDVQPVGSAIGTKHDFYWSAGGADAVFDGIFDQWLEDQAGNEYIARVVLEVGFERHSVGETLALDLQI